MKKEQLLEAKELLAEQYNFGCEHGYGELTESLRHMLSCVDCTAEDAVELLKHLLKCAYEHGRDVEFGEHVAKTMG